MKLNTIIVDDSIEARELLSHYCQKNESINLIAKCDCAKEGLSVLSKEKVDLILLDIEMPDLSGIDFVNLLETLPMVIFTTSKEEYAFYAFELEAIDYIKKPFNYSRFEKGIHKALEKQGKIKKEILINEGELPSSIFIKEKGRHVRLNTKDILYFENVSDYVRIFIGDEQHLIYSTLKNIAAKLPTSQFLRIHRSYIVNLDKIVDIEENTLVIGRTVIPIGKAHKSNLMRHLKLI